MERIKTALVVMAMLFIAGNAYATSTTKTLNVWNYDDTVREYGTVTVSDEGDKITFTVAANNDFFAGVPVGSTNTPTLTWDKFFFNVTNASALDMSKFSFASEGWEMVPITNGSSAVSSLKKSPGGSEPKDPKQFNASQFGLFREQAKYAGSTVQNDPLVFYYNDGAVSVEDFVLKNADGYYFSGHLRNILSPYVNDGDGTEQSLGSVYLAADDTVPVPEPGSMLLLGAGCLGLAIYGKRRKK